MKILRTPVTLVAASLALALTLAGCTGASTETATATAATAAPLQVEEIRLTTKDGASQDGQAEILTVKQPIQVQITTTGTSKRATLEATLFDLRDGQAVAVVTQPTETDGTPATLLLTLARADGDWNEGRHLLELKLDGALLAHRDVDIMASP